MAAAQEELVWALHLWGASEALREAMDTPIPPVYRLEYERVVTAARAELGNEGYGRAWAEGRTLTPQQAMAAHYTERATE